MFRSTLSSICGLALIATTVSGQFDANCLSSGFTAIGDREIVGNNLGGLIPAANTPACLNACADTDGCTGWTYFSNQFCQLHTGSVSSFTFQLSIGQNAGFSCDPQSNFELAVSQCSPDGFAVLGNKAIVGTEFGALQGASNTLVCQELCASVEECAAFVYFSNATCQLFTENFRLELDSDSSNAGYRCDPVVDFAVQDFVCDNTGYTILSGFSVAQGQTLGGLLAAATTLVCRNLCTSATGCTGFTYFGNSACQLYSGDVFNLGFSINTDNNAGYVCDVPTPFALQRFESNEDGFTLMLGQRIISGDELGNLEESPSTAACLASCVGSEPCTGYTYYPNATCQLRQGSPLDFDFTLINGVNSGFSTGAARLLESPDTTTTTTTTTPTTTSDSSTSSTAEIITTSQTPTTSGSDKSAGSFYCLGMTLFVAMLGIQ